jgi:uncharacterized protein (DUF2147 family)
MKFFIAAIFLMFTISLHAQSVTGKWQTIDDETGKVRSVVEIYSEKGKVFGKIIEITDKSRQDRLCDACSGANKNKAMLGMVIIKNLEKDDDEWEDGTILDPESGKVYKCYITLEETNKLKVRGFIGFSLLGRTQYWTRVQ